MKLTGFEYEYFHGECKVYLLDELGEEICHIYPKTYDDEGPIEEQLLAILEGYSELSV